jgi:ribose transport system ATP-binding protein
MPSDEILLSVEGITKSFPGVMALRGVAFDLRAGEIHALVGENGAGKSTLMRIVAGVYRADAGRISVRGRTTEITSPSQAHRLGISMVYQDTRLVPDLDVVQNIFLGHEPVRSGLVDRAQMESRAAKILARLDLTLDAHMPVRELPLAQRQGVEIGRALSRDACVLILDEPTTGLAGDEVQTLFRILRDLCAAGHGIVFISHRLPEVLQIADRITVMKDGDIVATVPAAGISEDDLVKLMVGREMALTYPPKADSPGAVRLAAEGLASPGAFSEVSLSLRAGEIVGLGGIQGNGQREILRALAGLLPTSGRITADGHPVRLNSPAAALRQGIVYLSNDRRGEALFLPHSVRENVSLPHLPSLSHLGVVSDARERSSVLAVVEQLRVQTPSLEQPVEFLSGGNQQKVVVGRWLMARPAVYLFDEPTQGVDVATKLELYRTIRQLANEGAAVLVLSTEVIELLGLCDRILVVADGRIVDVVEAGEATEERVVGSAVKAERDAGCVPGSRSVAACRRAPNWMVQRWSSSALVLGIILVLAFLTQLYSPYFLRPRNLGDLATQTAPLALVGMGQMSTLLIGGIDLSVGPTMSLTTAIASYLMTPETPTVLLVLGILACLAVGATVGLVNGALVRYLRIPDLIATLATYSAVYGVALLVRPAPGGAVHPGFMEAVTHRVGAVPVITVAAVLAIILGEIILLRGRAGIALYATGSSREAALVAGLPVDRIRQAAYLFSGVMAAVAGLVLAARIGSGDPNSGSNFTLASVTAVVVGGTSIFGGRGSLLGTLAGAILVMETQNALNQLHVSSYWQYVWMGGLTLLAVALYALREHGLDWGRLARWLRRGNPVEAAERP